MRRDNEKCFDPRTLLSLRPSNNNPSIDILMEKCFRRFDTEFYLEFEMGLSIVLCGGTPCIYLCTITVRVSWTRALGSMSSRGHVRFLGRVIYMRIKRNACGDEGKEQKREGSEKSGPHGGCAMFRNFSYYFMDKII